MHAKNALLIGAAFVAGATLTKFIKDRDIDLQNFLDEALARGFSEIQSARLALEKSNSTNVKIFAQRTMDDYNTFNQRLIEIAQKKALAVPAVEDYQHAAQPYVMHPGTDSFDENYVNHRLNSHKGMIKLFRWTGRSNDPLLREFLSNTLDQLDHHLRMAQELAETLHSNTIPTTSPQSADFVEEPDYKI